MGHIVDGGKSPADQDLAVRLLQHGLHRAVCAGARVESDVEASGGTDPGDAAAAGAPVHGKCATWQDVTVRLQIHGEHVGIEALVGSAARCERGIHAAPLGCDQGAWGMEKTNGRQPAKSGPEEPVHTHRVSRKDNRRRGKNRGRANAAGGTGGSGREGVAGEASAASIRRIVPGARNEREKVQRGSGSGRAVWDRDDWATHLQAIAQSWSSCAPRVASFAQSWSSCAPRVGFLHAELELVRSSGRVDSCPFAVTSLVPHALVEATVSFRQRLSRIWAGWRGW